VRQLDHGAARFKHELLSRHGIIYDNIPAWQRRDVGIYWGTYEKEGYDLIAQRAVIVRRRRLTANMDLPMDETYDTLLRYILRVAEKSAP